MALFKKFGLKGKIIAAMILAGLLPLLGYALTNSIMVSESMEAASYKQMSTLRDTKRKQLENYLSDVGRHLISVAENTMTVDAIDLMNMAFIDLSYNITHYKTDKQFYIQTLTDYYTQFLSGVVPKDAGITLNPEALIPPSKESLIAQKIYIADNDNIFSEKDALADSDDESRYSLLHGEYHPVFRSLLRRYGYEDLYLTDAESGNIIYSVFKKPDFASNLVSGPFKNSNLAKSFNAAMQGEVGQVYLSGLNAYAPSLNENALFLSTPIKSGRSVIGVLSFQLSHAVFDQLLSEGIPPDSGTTIYVVSEEAGLVSHSNYGESTPQQLEEHDEAFDRSDLGFTTGNTIIQGAQDQEVLASYTPLDFSPLDWLLVVEEPASNIYESIYRLQAAGIWIALLGTAFIVAAAYLLARGVLGQLGSDPKDLKTVAEAIASEKWNDVDEIAADRKSPVGVFRSMLEMKENIQSMILSEQKSSKENRRILHALNSVKSCVLVTDANFDIIYHNRSFEKLVDAHPNEFGQLVTPAASGEVLFTASKDLKSKLNGIVNANEHRINPGVSELQYAEFHTRIHGNLVKSESGELLGGVFEWADRTDGDAIEEEIQFIVNCAMQGDLSKRISTQGKVGFFERLSHGINTMVDVNEKSLNEAIRSLSAMANGDLSKPVESTYSGKFGNLSQDINTTIYNLAGVVSQIESSSDQVLDASDKILEDNKQLSERTERQSSKLKETASSMDHIMSTVNQNAENANRANDVASDAKQTAEKGATVVKQAVSAMDEISDSSKEIVDIITVIDDIAFQTNLLALNAAVEAARAGDQGRGFAVVANEVRNLAGRSAVAAKEIKDLIQKSVDKVGEGSRLVNNSGETLEDIIESVVKVSNIVAEIANASSDQSHGIAQVNKAVTQMEEMTQKNAAMVFQATHSIKSMKDQSMELRDLIGFFNNAESAESLSQTEYDSMINDGQLDTAA